MTTAGRNSALPIGLAALALVSIALGFAFALADTAADRALLAARYTARAGFVAFTVVFVAGPLAQLMPGQVSIWLARRRRQLGLATAFVMAAHLVALSINIGLYRPRALADLLPGALVYSLIFAMALTSTDTAQRRMGRWWGRLHNAGIALAWIAFAQSYVGRLFVDEYFAVGIVFAPLVFAILLIRVVSTLRRGRSIA